MEKHSPHRTAGSAIVAREMEARAWTPRLGLARLRTLAADRAITVRYLVAANRHTPQSVLRGLAADGCAMVAWAAQRRPRGSPNFRRVPVAVMKQIMRYYLNTEDPCETFYRFALLGLFRIDGEGRIWRTGWIGPRRNGDPFFCIRRGRPEPAAYICRADYPTVVFSYHCFRITIGVHRLVYRAFVGRMRDGYMVHHVDLNTHNNRPENLQLLLSADHGREHGTDARSRHAHLLPDEVRGIRGMLEGGASVDDVAGRYGVSRRTVLKIKHRRE